MNMVKAGRPMVGGSQVASSDSGGVKAVVVEKTGGPQNWRDGLCRWRDELCGWRDGHGDWSPCQMPH